MLVPATKISDPLPRVRSVATRSSEVSVNKVRVLSSCVAEIFQSSIMKISELIVKLDGIRCSLGDMRVFSRNFVEGVQHADAVVSVSTAGCAGRDEVFVLLHSSTNAKEHAPLSAGATAGSEVEHE